jgi:hypothetical protein
MDEVKERVTADVRTVGAFEKAKEAAQATLDTAKTKWLQSVANEQGRTMISTGLFSPSDAGRNGMGVIGYDVKGAALESFVQGAFKLLTLAPRSGEAPRPPATQATTQATTKPATRQQASTTKPAAATAPATSAPVITAFKDHPVGLIEVPAEAKVVVAEVDQVKPMWTKDRQAMWDTAIASQQRVSTEQLLRQAWFNYDHVVRRVSFVPAEKRDRKPPVEMPPPNPF